MKVTEEQINEIRASTDIVEVISEYVTLKKKGKTYFGLCPFHAETAPSFAVDRERQIFHCFGCGEGGNVFSFLMKKENISFPEALKLVAKRRGIELIFSEEERKKSTERDTIYQANDFAAQFFQKYLTSSEEGKKGLQYLLDRGIDIELIKKFRLGFSPDRWDSLLKAAKKAMISEKILLDAGLVLKRDKESGYYDRFRGRIMFTIQNEFGQVLGFGARRMDDNEDTPKYINTPETSVYHKGRFLYGIFQAKESIRNRDNAVLVEGYTDILALYQNGITNVLATSGTALTSGQAHLIARYTGNVTLIFDADSAGLKAAVRGAEVLFENNLNVTMVNLGKGNDPDTFIRTHGKEEFNKILEGSLSFIDFFIGLHESEGDLSSYEGKARCISELMDFIVKVPDRIKKELMIKDVGEKLSIGERILYQEMNKKVRGKREKDEEEAKMMTEAVGLDPLERDILFIIFHCAEVVKSVVNVLDVDDFDNYYAKRIFSKIKSLFEENVQFNPSELIDFIVEEDGKKLIAELLMPAPFNSDNVTEEIIGADGNKLEEILCLLKSRRIERQIEEIRKKIKELEARGEDTSELLSRYTSYIKENIEYKKGGILWRSF